MALIGIVVLECRLYEDVRAGGTSVIPSLAPRKQCIYMSIDLHSSHPGQITTTTQRRHEVSDAHHVAFVRCLHHTRSDGEAWSLHATLQSAVSFRIALCIHAEFHRRTRNTSYACNLYPGVVLAFSLVVFSKVGRGFQLGPIRSVHDRIDVTMYSPSHHRKRARTWSCSRRAKL